MVTYLEMSFENDLGYSLSDERKTQIALADFVKCSMTKTLM